MGVRVSREHVGRVLICATYDDASYCSIEASGPSNATHTHSWRFFDEHDVARVSC